MTDMQIEQKTKTCPFCGETILDVAIKCKHCGTDLTAQPPATTQPAKSNELLGQLLLLIPICSIFLVWFYVGSMRLIENPGSMLNLVGIGTVILTAIIISIEASQLGFATDKSKKENSPLVWFFGTLLLWIAVYPYYLYKRKEKGKNNYFVVGLLIAIIFMGSLYVMNTAINDKVQEIQNIFR